MSSLIRNIDTTLTDKTKEQKEGVLTVASVAIALPAILGLIAKFGKTATNIVNKVIGFVKDYGMSNNFNYILGSNEAGSVLYGDDAMDLTQEILKSLNEAYSKN